MPTFLPARFFGFLEGDFVPFLDLEGLLVGLDFLGVEGAEVVS